MWLYTSWSTHCSQLPDLISSLLLITFLWVLENDHRFLLGKCSITEQHSRLFLFCFNFIFWDRVSWSFPGWPHPVAQALNLWPSVSGFPVAQVPDNSIVKSAQIVPSLPVAFFPRCCCPVPCLLPLGPTVWPSTHKPKLHTNVWVHLLKGSKMNPSVAASYGERGYRQQALLSFEADAGKVIVRRQNDILPKDCYAKGFVVSILIRQKCFE